MTWGYWTLFAVVVVLWLAPPLADWHERRADRKDAETWARMAGSVTSDD